MTTPENATWRDRIEAHSGLALSALYLLLIGIGMMYEVWLFLHFSVNILYYAEAADFLLVPFREPLVVLVCVAPIPLFWLYMRTARWLWTTMKWTWKERGRNARTSMNVLALVLWSTAFTAEYAKWVSNRIRDGHRQSVTIQTTSARTIAGPLIGTTGKFLFVYDAATKQTRIVTVDNIEQIVIQPRKKRRAGL
jgi:hypothetical protein